MFSFLDTFWSEILYKPIYNLVILTYNITPGPSFGIAIIGLAILIRFIFLYFTLIGYKHEEQLASVKPQMDSIQQDNTLTSKEKLIRVSNITNPLGINPLLASIPLFAQIIFLGVLYQIIQVGIYSGGYDNLYGFVHKPANMNTMFFGIDLAKTNLILAFTAAFILFLERIWEYNQKKDIGKSFAQKWDPLIWPAGSFIILLILPSAKAVFLITSVAFTFIIKGIVHISKPKNALTTGS